MAEDEAHAPSAAPSPAPAPDGGRGASGAAPSLPPPAAASTSAQPTPHPPPAPGQPPPLPTPSAPPEPCAWAAAHRVAPHVRSIFYLPDYVTPGEEARLLREVAASRAKWVQLSGRRLQQYGGVVGSKGLVPAPMPAWLAPLLARLAEEEGPYGSSGGGAGGGSTGGGSTGGGLYGGAPPNHVLVNSYMPGEGIMAHEDGPSYHPVVAILSLGAPAVLRFTRKRAPGGEAGQDGPQQPHDQHAQQQPQQQQPQQGQQGQQQQGQQQGQQQPQQQQQPVASVLLLPRSLVVFCEDAFTACLHGIDQVHSEQLDASVANLDACRPAIASATVAAAAAAAASSAAAAATALTPAAAAEARDGEPGSGAPPPQAVTPPPPEQPALPPPLLLLPRGGERVSFTVRRVPRVLPALLRPRG